jgi:hypothetical protein
VTSIVGNCFLKDSLLSTPPADAVAYPKIEMQTSDSVQIAQCSFHPLKPQYGAIILEYVFWSHEILFGAKQTRWRCERGLCEFDLLGYCILPACK